ncbi:MAG: prenyltransferase/squalene oxidase repeat-containing protein [Akkermansiaceae bacterium]
MKTFLENARAALLAERNQQGYWSGELSSSALSTATAMIALHFVDPNQHAGFIKGGCDWLRGTQNRDGGWGDTSISFSNISTTLLAWSALSLLSGAEDVIADAEDWIRAHVGSLDPDEIKGKVIARYGKDKTFSVPILMACALCGRLGASPRDGWRRVLALPFELAAFPRRWYGALKLPVVSYALPALIAIGYARHYHAKPFFLFRPFRALTWRRVSRILAEIQPESGGYLEATPLTSFVTMALAGADQKDHPVISRAIGFIKASVRRDGSWPIDTNLATWGTTLAVKSLTVSECAPSDFPEKDRCQILTWLLEQQYRTVHPFTISPPGGWAWTDLSGGVPDADDTSGALLALHRLASEDREVQKCAAAGVTWLLDLQNRDGGIPTFCRGWGALPFDRSSPDITAHALRALMIWNPQMTSALQIRISKAVAGIFRYLKSTQACDGSWTPLWFGNQYLEAENNQTYGTAMVVLALADLEFDLAAQMHQSGLVWLVKTQSVNGGWSGGDPTQPTSIEETALALSALSTGAHGRAVERAVDHLRLLTENGTHFPAAPVGFYFAKLWYWERLYPLVWTVEALEKVK